MNETKTSKTVLAGNLLLLLSTVAAFISTLQVFTPCGPKEDGSFMVCHWAHEGIKLLLIIAIVIAVLHFFFKDVKVKTGLALSLIPVALGCAFLPGNSINLCMMHDMRCHTVMAPGVRIVGILLVVCALIDLYLVRKAK